MTTNTQTTAELPVNSALTSSLPALSTPQQDSLQPEAWLTIMMWSLLVLTILLISPLRTFLGRLLGSLVQWMLAEGGMLMGRSLLYLGKSVFTAHLILIRNLLSPRSTMVVPKEGDKTDDFGG